jgi:hypothetical protein
MSMSRRRFGILVAAFVAVNAFFWLAQGSFALPRGLIDHFFGPRLIRAEVVVRAGPGVVNDFRIDRGMITAVSPGMIVLRERDGTIVTIAVARRARVVGDFSVTDVSQLRPPMRVLVVRKANGPATTIQIEGRG